MQNSEIGRVLSETADMLELTGANFFRVRAYRNAARAVFDYPANFADLSLDQMTQAAGIGKDLSAKIETLVKTGELALHRELSAKVPAGVFALMHLPGLGPKHAMQISRELGIADLAQLKAAVEAGALRTIRGLGPKMEEKLLEHLNREQTTKPKRWLYSDAAVEVDNLLDYLRGCDAVERAEAAGSFRRGATPSAISISSRLRRRRPKSRNGCSSIHGPRRRSAAAIPRPRSSSTTACKSTCVSCRRRATVRR
jgi:DNA polymerase (family 10)